MTTALYPGSFDPITNGHLDIVKRASKLFERVIIGIYDRPNKKLMFSVEERVNLVREAVKDIKNVEVMAYNGLTVEFARQMGVHVMVRGLRMSSDFEGEFELAMMNKKLMPDLELVCFMSNLRYQFLSSSLLKEAGQLGGNIEDLVPEHVSRALKEKFNQSSC